MAKCSTKQGPYQCEHSEGHEGECECTAPEYCIKGKHNANVRSRGTNESRQMGADHDPRDAKRSD